MAISETITRIMKNRFMLISMLPLPNPGHGVELNLSATLIMPHKDWEHLILSYQIHNNRYICILREDNPWFNINLLYNFPVSEEVFFAFKAYVDKARANE